MDPNSSWRSVHCQLQMEMPKATFDTWVRDAEFVSFENDVFTIGVLNDFAREWLESRLTSTAKRMLTGILNSSVDVQFVVHQPGPDENKAEDLFDNEAEEKINAGMQISIERDLLATFTKPDRALYFPGYWLRWVPYIGAKPFATILAFRQALYIAEGCFKEKYYISISAEAVAKIIGTTRQTISRQRDGWRRKDGTRVPGKLGWFLSHQKTEKYSFDDKGQPNREAFRYAFKQSPITPGDIEDILEWLLDNGLETDPVEVISKAIEAQPLEIIKFPMPAPSRVQKKVQPGSAKSDLTANILSCCDQNLSSDTRKQVFDLVNVLKARIMESDGLVKVPLYYFNHIMPFLGIQPAMAGIYLRKKAYRNTETGEIRESVILRNGIKELATFLGISLSRVYEFFPTKGTENDKLNQIKKSNVKPSTSDWSQERKERMKALILGQSKNDEGELTLKIATTDFLVPDHQVEYDLALQLVSFLVENATPEEVTELFTPAGENGQSDSEYVTITISENQTIGNSEYVTIKDSDNLTMEDSENTTMGFSEKQTQPLIEKFRISHDIKYLKFKYLSLEILKNLILNLITNLNTLTTHQITETQKIQWTPYLGKVWDFSKLFKSCRINQKSQTELLENNAVEVALVSQLIYAFSPKGQNLNHPLKFAISQILRPGDGNLGHSPRYDRLASLGPAGLQELIKNSKWDGFSGLSIGANIRGAQDWERIMQGHKNNAFPLELGELLGILKISYSK